MHGNMEVFSRFVLYSSSLPLLGLMMPSTAGVTSNFLPKSLLRKLRLLNVLQSRDGHDGGDEGARFYVLGYVYMALFRVI